MADEGLNQHMADLNDSVERAKDIGRRAMEEGYDSVREYADRGKDYVADMSDNLADFVARDPWIANRGCVSGRLHRGANVPADRTLMGEAMNSESNERSQDAKSLTETIREHPLTALGVAAAAGFVWGGGASGRLGLAMILAAGRFAARGALMNLMSGVVAENGRGNRRNRTRVGGSATGSAASRLRSESKDRGDRRAHASH